MTDTVPAIEHATPERGPLEIRSAPVETLDVSFPRRRIELIVMPFEQEAIVEHRGKLVVEVVSAGAFQGVENRRRPPRAFRDHDRRQVFGHAAALEERAGIGLVADIECSRTPLGDETLTLAADGTLDASAGFNVLRGGEKWNMDRTRRRLTRLWLDHVALTAAPAYPGAEILNVRHAPLPAGMVGNLRQDPGGPIHTPRKDAALARLAALGYDPSQ